MLIAAQTLSRLRTPEKCVFFTFTYLPALVLHSVDAVLVDSAPDPGPVQLAVREAVVELDVAVFVLQLVRYVGVKWNEDEELLGAATPEAVAMRAAKRIDGLLQTCTDPYRLS